MDVGGLDAGGLLGGRDSLGSRLAGSRISGSVGWSGGRWRILGLISLGSGFSKVVDQVASVHL